MRRLALAIAALAAAPALAAGAPETTETFVLVADPYDNEPVVIDAAITPLPPPCEAPLPRSPTTPPGPPVPAPAPCRP